MNGVKAFKKIIRSVCALCLGCVTFLGATACKDTQGNVTLWGVDKVDIWEAPNTEKYRIDQAIPDGVSVNDVRLTASAAGNEYESVQLMLTAKSKVDFYDIAVSDLKKGEDIISRSNVEILVEKYIYVPVPTNSTFPVGWYPDAIIPMDAMLEQGENTIEKGNNQAILIRAYVPKDTPAGVYEGTVFLNVEGKVKEIPYALTVYGFNVPEEIHTKTAFNLWSTFSEASDHLSKGHYYNDLELYTKYYNELLEYRVTASEIPSYAGTDAVQYAEDLYNTLLDERVSAYNLPVMSVAVARNGQTYRLLDVNAMENSLRAIVEKGLQEGKDLLEKAYLYVPTLDEPNYDKYWAVIESSLDFRDLKNRLAEAYDFSAVPSMEESLRNIPNLTTIIDISKISDLEGYVDTWVPIVHNWDDNAKKNFLEERALAGDNIWWYTCVNPKNPYPSYHIDDNLISSRLLSWMQKANNVEGNLYWSVNFYAEVSGGLHLPRDFWENPMAYNGAAGDGYLFYPGTEYGIDGPIGTIRLESIRDGSEDYEYLYLLEELIDKAADKYSIALDLTDAVELLYDSLFTNVTPIVDSEMLKIAREEIAQMIMALQNDTVNPLITVDGFSAKNQSVTLGIYCEEGTAVKVNGVAVTASPAVSGEGVRYTVTLPLPENQNYADVTLTKNGETITVRKYLGTRLQYVTDFSEAGLITSMPVGNACVELSSNTDAHYVTAGEGSLKVTVKAKPDSTNIAEKMAFGFTNALVNLKNAVYMRYIEFDVYNASDRDFVITATTNLHGDLSGVNCEKGKWTHVKMALPTLPDDLTADGQNAVLRNFQISTTVFKEGTDLVYYVDNIYFRLGE